MSMRRELQAELERALAGTGLPVVVADAREKSLGGSHPRNIVNRYCHATGIQIEQSSRARREHWQVIADAVTRFYSHRL